ncbi:sulfotransferase [Glycomyces sp. NPDC046736]|uniref:sulfotransferase family protein n=1 Tax=Glycomyces sp. NPDC046736 TaxID=3155615 RepID=UPI0033D3D990
MLPVVNGVVGLVRRRGDGGEVYARLLAKHGVDRGDDPGFHADMEFLLREVAAVSGLSALGWFSFCADVEARMLNRVRIRGLHAAHPEIGREAIDAPIVVVGLPRTATTFMHQVLAGAPGSRGPKLWEWSHTDLPLPEKQERKVVGAVAAGMKTVSRLAPGMRVIHLPDAELPDECAFLLPQGEQHLARAPMPGYEEWLRKRDFAPDYEYLHQALQVLQHRRPPARWVLKCPIHLGRLPLVRKVFPDATIVWTHRDPVPVTGSICSLVETSRAMHLRRMGEAERHDVGRMALGAMAGLAARACADRPGIPCSQIIDVPYASVATDPLDAFEALFDRLGLTWNDAEAARVKTLAERGPGGAHRYDIDRYGITETDVDQAFSEYAALGG